MEVNQKSQQSASSDDLLWPSLDHQSHDTSSSAKNPAKTADLLWPSQLINQQFTETHTENHWPLTLATFSFVLASVFAFFVGPVQVILLSLTKDYAAITGSYYPAVLKSMLICSGLLAIVNLVALIMAWRSSPRVARLTAVFAAGAISIFGIGWLAAFVIAFQPNQLAATVLLAILVFWAVALIIAKQYSSQPTPSLTLRSVLVGLMLVASVDLIATGCYLFQRTQLTELDTATLAELSAAELAARLEGIPEDLGRRIYAICGEPYRLVFQSPTDPETALFECESSAEVYSVSVSREDAQAPATTYLGQTKHPLIEAALPDARYFYRDLSALGQPSELTLLLPASSEVELVDQNLVAFQQILATTGALNLTVFWVDNLDAVLSTRDFVLITAVGTLSLVDYLPRGATYFGVEADRPIQYSFQLDSRLVSLRDLGADPLLYPAATRNAIKTNPHLRYLQPAPAEPSEPTEPSEEPAPAEALDILRETLLNSFVQPD